jgi:hypothetical protein
MSYLYLPFIFQSILMGIDEHLHRKRGLGMWERLGHPLDTLTVFVPLSYISKNDFSSTRQIVYIILSIFSCFFITKDEFVHARECSPFENWLHSLLFVLHPLIFLCSGIIWRYHPENNFLFIQSLLICIFMIYQVLQWSLKWKQKVR